MARLIYRYGLEFYNLPDGTPEEDDLRIEMYCIQHKVGSAVEHYDRMRRLIWPELDSHRWHRLIMETIVTNKCTVMAGVGSSGKSHEAAATFLLEYWCWPDETCVLISSTHIEGLKNRIWSEITSLWQRGVDRFSWLAGHNLSSTLAILTDDLGDKDVDERRARDFRKGIKGVACRNSSGAWVGINRYMGIKQKRMRLIADEANQMEQEYIKGISNLNTNPDFKCCIIGNFDQPTDCLGRCAEPADGWTGHMEPRKTTVWKTKFPLEGVCINLIGFDSPNFDKANPSDPDPFPYLIGPKKIDEIRRGYGEQSIEFMSQAWGCMKIATLAHRVLTRELCEAGHAFDDVIWEGSPRVKVASLDSSWGGDRPVFTEGEFGKEVGGKIVLKSLPPEIVPISSGSGMDPDYAIATWIKARCEQSGIPAANFFHDSTGRGTLGTALSRIWSADCNPVEFGGRPTDRPVTSEYWWYDPVTGERRIKLCSEHYLKFVTELWFSVHYCVQAGQWRGMNEDVFEEFAARIWRQVGDRREVEPKSGTKEKPGMKQRTGKSPDLADSAVILLEGARRRGFTISKLENSDVVQRKNEWLKALAKEHRDFIRQGELVES